MVKVNEKSGLIQIDYQKCKACGICYSLCPKGVLDKDGQKKVIIKDASKCIQCYICEEHCPDYCIKIG